MASSLYVLHCEMEKLDRQAADLSKAKELLSERLMPALEALRPGNATAELKQLIEMKKQSEAEQAKSDKEESEEFLEDFKSNFSEILRLYAYCYDQTKNALFLWKIYSIHRTAGRPLPPLILAYLDQCAQNLFCNVYDLPLESIIQKESSSARRNEYAGEDCLKALNLHQKGRLNAFASMKKYMAKLFLMIDIEAVEKENLTENILQKEAEMAAIRSVHIMQEKALGKKAISYFTLYKYYQEYKESGKFSDFWR